MYEKSAKYTEYADAWVWRVQDEKMREGRIIDSAEVQSGEVKEAEYFAGVPGKYASSTPPHSQYASSKSLY